MTTINNPKMLTAGKILQDRRKSLELSIDQVSKDTKIKKDYLEQIEADSFGAFKSEVFLLGYIKVYSQYLSLNTEKVIAVYRRTNIQEEEKKSAFMLQKGQDLLNFFKIQYVVILATVLGLGFFSYYIYGQLENFFNEPYLQVTSPSESIETTEKSFLVTGKTDEFSIVTVNDQEVALEIDYTFSKNVKLTEGQNNVIIKAFKKNNSDKQVQEVRRITYEPKTQPTQNPSPSSENDTDSRNIVSIRTKATGAYFLQVDGQELNQEESIVGEVKEFLVNEELSFKTDTPSNFELTLNNSPLYSQIEAVESNSVTVTCNFTNSILICDNLFNE